MLPLVAHLHLQGHVMYPCLDDMFHAQASLLQVSLTYDVILRLHFTLGFIINLKKLALMPTQVLLHLGA